MALHPLDSLAPNPASTEARSAWQAAWRRFRRHKLAMASAAVLAVIIVLCFSAPLIAPHSPSRVQGQRIFAPPNFAEGFYLGNDSLGRDVLSRLLYGGRVSLIVGFSVAFINALIGITLGATAGYFSGYPLPLLRGLWRPQYWRGWPLMSLIGMSVLLAVLFLAAYTWLRGWMYALALLALPCLMTVLWQLWLQPEARHWRSAWRWSLQALALALLSAWLWWFADSFTADVEATTARVVWLLLALALATLAYVGLWHRWSLDPDVLISRSIDFTLSIPTFPILLVLAGLLNDPNVGLSRTVDALFGPARSVVLIILVLASLGWITNARLVRGEMLKLRQQEYADAARALGVSNVSIILRHLLPNALAPLIVAITLDIGTYIIVEAGLSFLGFGIQEPAASWGNMLNGVQNFVLQAPWLALWPGLMIVLTVLSFNYIGDGLRDALDPRSRL